MSLGIGPEGFYGLSGRPFALAPDPAFFFGSTVHRRVLAYLESGVYQAEGFIVVTGEIGAGKTTLVRKLLGGLDPSKVVGAHLVSTMLDGEQILRMVAAAFGLRAATKSKAVLLGRLELFLRARGEEGKRALLVVDEAQNLSIAALEELRMLSNIQDAERSLMQTFLVGQPELRQLMAAEGLAQVRQRVVAACHLPALDPWDTRSYIEHRLTKVDWNGHPSFDDAAIDAIHAFTGGVPRLINTLCQRLLLLGFIEEKRALGVGEVREVIAEIESEMTFGKPFLAPPGGAEDSDESDDARDDIPSFEDADRIESQEPVFPPFEDLVSLTEDSGSYVAPMVVTSVPVAVKPAPLTDDPEVDFAFPDNGVISVQVSGSWDEWSARTPMQRDDHGYFRARVRVRGRGPHVYKYLIDGTAWIADPSNGERVHDGYDGDNSVLRIP